MTISSNKASRNNILTGVPTNGAWAYLALKKLAELPKRPLVLLRSTEEDLEEVAEGMAALAPLFPALPAGSPALFGPDERERWASLERLHSGAAAALATPAGLDAPVPSKDGFGGRRLRIASGSSHPYGEILRGLAELGFARADFAQSPGEYAARGAVVDFFPLEPLAAVRLLFNGSRVESIRALDPETQTSGAFLDEAALAPVHGAETAARVFDWLSDAGLWLAEDGLRGPEPSCPVLRVSPSAAEDSSDFGAGRPPAFQGNFELAARQMLEWREKGFRVLLYSLNRGEDERMQELLEGRLRGGACQFLIGALRSGFVHGPDRLAVLSSSELFGRSYGAAPRWLRYAGPGRRRGRGADLETGDYVVHRQYGIGRYLGIKPVETDGEGLLDCLQIEYRGSDKLYVPLYDFQMVQKYVGAEGHRPRLSSLDTRSWEEVKERVREGVRELAGELLKIQAEREGRPGHAFPPVSRMEAEFADSFPYEETQDQRRAIAEVLADMTAPRPMDRLVVGDVGFGKTEVAMRAAMKCVAGLKQAAVLVPTTILASQHRRTFSRRFAEYPVRVAELSRFTSAAEERRTLEGLRTGRVDVVIGTHRLLSADVGFKDLGLLVVDEEHRFGVRHKERLKALKREVDVLSLSATPIPRTLYQALTGLRKVSLIQSPPPGRQGIRTWVGAWSEGVAAAAVKAELDRGGQAYYVHNRVRRLEETLGRLRSLLPGVRFGVAHGQMPERTLEKTMWDFMNREFDVLVASSIIESGLDIPTVNTLLVEDSQDFGLAQLYQLRGRIGRERRRAYCYLFYPPGAGPLSALPEESRKRLSALREFAELGSGFKLAMRDLEIRGAGDLLGARQHGLVNAVGVEFYSGLLQEEVARLKGKPLPAPAPPVHLDLGVPAHLPESHLPGEAERLEFYKRLLAAGPRDLPKLRTELADLSGPLPAQAENLFKIMELRARCAAAGVREAAFAGGRFEVRFRGSAAVPAEVLERWGSLYGTRLEFVRDPEGDGVRVRAAGEEPLAWLEAFLGALESRSG